jgi:hypothetical protein
MVDHNSSLSVEEQVKHPDWVGLRHKMSQEIEEIREYGVEVFI